MAADRQDAAGDGEIAVAKRAPDDGLLRQERLQFAPESDALQQGPRVVEARQPERQGRV